MERTLPNSNPFNTWLPPLRHRVGRAVRSSHVLTIPHICDSWSLPHHMTRALLFSLTNVVSGGTYQQADRSCGLSRGYWICRGGASAGPCLLPSELPTMPYSAVVPCRPLAGFKFLGCGSWCLVQGETDAERDQHYNDFFEKIHAQVQGHVARDRTPSLIASEVVHQAVDVAYK